jgi:hypothetical protein
MMTAETMRKNAQNCWVLAESVNSEPVRKRYLRMGAAWEELAKSQDWLDGRLRSHSSVQPDLDTAA